MLLVYVRYETSYDNALPNAENTYQLQTYYTEKATGETTNLQMASYVSGQRLKAQISRRSNRMVYASSPAASPRCGMARPSASRMRAWSTGSSSTPSSSRLLHGDPASALANPGSIALSETEARRLFGTDNPIGQTLTLMMRGRQVDHRVTAVFRDLPRNSHMRFAMLARYDPVSLLCRESAFPAELGLAIGLVLFPPAARHRPSTITGQLQAWERRIIPTQTIDGISYNPGDESNYGIANVRDIHLGDAQEARDSGQRHAHDLTFPIIAFLILGMACVNFTNLATARASQRAREVALRKVLGANRRQLIIQFLGESVLIACISMLLALALVELLLPALRQLPRCRPEDAPISAGTACCFPSGSPSWSAPPAASIPLSTSPASSRRRC